MPKPTLQEQLIAGLLQDGEHEVPFAGRKYRKFTRTKLGGDTFYYVGKSGALRFGRTVEESIPASQSRKNYFLNKPTH